MDKSFKILTSYIKNFNLSTHLFLLIFIAFSFSVLARFYWVSWASNFAIFFWDNTLMISTNDGYAFAEGARDMLAGFHQENDLSYFGSSLSTLTFYIVKIFGIKLETAMLYMSVFFSSLIVVPILLIANEYKNLKIGFVAALIASVANSYYNRTMAGYYDTDMLVIVLPMFIIWGLIRLAQNRQKADLIIAVIFVLIYNWWYLSGFSLLAMTIAIFTLYTLIFERKNLLFYAQIALLLIAIANLNFYLKILIILAFYTLSLTQKNLWQNRFIFGFLALCVAIFALCGGLKPIIFQLKFYVFRDVSELNGLSFKFFNVNQTILESGMVDFSLFCERISGSLVVFFISFFGLLLLCFKHKNFCISLGMILLGFLSFKSGLRFTIYAVPVMAMGFGYFVVWILEILNIKDRLLSNILYVFLAILALYPIQNHIKEYKISPVFVKSEVEILNQLKGIAGREDYVLTWWDYGYPIRFYSDVKTLIDGGKHLGRDNFAVSYALSQNQAKSADMARLEVEYTERNFKERFGVNLAKMMSDANATNVNEYLNTLGNGVKIPPKTREIYYYLPDRMTYIYPTILQFSRLDLNSGKSWGDPLFLVFESYAQNEKGIDFGGGNILLNDFSTILINRINLSINTFFEVKTDENDKVVTLSVQNDPNSNIFVVFMRDYGRFLVLDESMLNSTFIQLFVFENYDEKLFEPVILQGAAKVYRLKI
ncbi:STT3 domain-containing protein [Campylobacter gastrosuis]|uniref:General glycosylation pathway protein n=1 Tax=Campylobacter gastrosuis TaxID=2974576 RepID=A0ABT7HPZ8_9BACT|nr:STT3 domain-containing protein [Campylobacter gastrosuis]MDL0088698.1 general glycosylation pathway protein [Campylobacter gastrosuis]